MKAEFINPFMQGAQSVLSMVCNEQASLGKVYLKAAPYKDEISVLVGIVGNPKGFVAYTMNESVTCYLASQMMMGMPVDEINEMTMSAVSELANIISGNVATLFSGLGKSIDITPPKFLTGATDLNSQLPSTKLMVIPLILKSGEVFEINVWVEEV